MKALTPDEYSNYRLEMLAKANGRNIHKVNGLLGNVLNNNENASYWIGKDNEQAAECITNRDAAMQELDALLN